MTKKDRIAEHFRKHDPVIHELLKRVALPHAIPTQTYFDDLCDSIISQQLSIKAAATIFKRFKDLFPQGNIDPEYVLTIPTETLRQAGLSYAKIKYIQDLAQKVINKEIHLDKLQHMTNEEIINELIKVKGIGVWTAEMFLMFTLCREDVFSCGDLGLQNAIKKAYGLKEKPTKKQMLELSAKWSPYRTLASRLLWRSLTV